MMEIVIAAPSMLIVAPSGIETEYISRSRPSSSQSSMLTGMLAAELLVKNAVTPLSRRQRIASGKPFLLINKVEIVGLTTSAEKSMQPTSSRRSFPYVVKIERPLVETLSKTIPQIPNGAKLMIQRTAVDTASEMSFRACFVVSLAFLDARPRTTAQKRIPMYLPWEIASIGLAIMLRSRFPRTSPMPDGAACSAASATRTRVCGNMKLPTTAVTAAASVLTM